MPENAAAVLVRILEDRGIQRVYCVAGESFLAVLDALYDSESVDTVACRHEGSAGFMAIAEAKLTGRAGVCLVNRGPGAMNLAIALHSTEQDATPLVLFVGQVQRGDIGRRAFQEVDYATTFGSITKGVWVVYEARRLAEMVHRAFQVAESGTPGPTVVVLPEDLLTEQISSERAVPTPPRALALTSADLTEVTERISRAERPLLIAGGRLGGHHQDGRSALHESAAAHALPVVTSNKHQDLFDNDHPNYAGHLNIATSKEHAQLLDEADLLLAIGARLDDITTQNYSFPRLPRPRQPLIHVYPDPERLGEIYETALPFACDPVIFLRGLAARDAAAPSPKRREWIRRLHEHEDRLARWTPSGEGNVIDMGEVVTWLSRHAPDDAVVTVDAGNFTSWVHRYFRFRSTQRLLGISSSAMGFGVPGGVASALCLPGRQVITFVGDGGFLMTGNELATAVERGTKLLIVVVNNNSYGTIRHHQEKSYPGRVIATDLRNPDFAALAEAYGAIGLTLSDPKEIESVLLTALSHPGPVLLEVRTDVERISAYQTLSAIHATADRRHHGNH